MPFASCGLNMGRESSFGDDGRGDPGVYVSCPYDPNHRMPQSRYVFHVRDCRIKFRRAHPEESNFTVCPWNARHEMPEDKYAQHLVGCPDRMLKREEALWFSRAVGGNVTAPEPTQLCMLEENWEDEIAANSGGAYSPRARSDGVSSGRTSDDDPHDNWQRAQERWIEQIRTAPRVVIAFVDGKAVMTRADGTPF